MKLVSWNVNGLRATLKKGFCEAFNALGADVFCLQETKMLRGQAEVGFEGYHEYWNSADKKGYSGTAVFTRVEPNAVTYGIGAEEHDREGRVITLDYGGFYLVNVYAPNSRNELERLPYRMEWEDAFRAYVIGLDAVKPVVICGDLNCAHTEMDIKNAKPNVKNAGFTVQERGKLTELLAAGFCDFYRRLNPDKRDAYTWWSHYANSRERNVGWRIDYFLGSDRLYDRVKDARIYPEVYGSDHCPVGLQLSVDNGRMGDEYGG